MGVWLCDLCCSLRPTADILRRSIDSLVRSRSGLAALQASPSVSLGPPAFDERYEEMPLVCKGDGRPSPASIHGILGVLHREIIDEIGHKLRGSAQFTLDRYDTITFPSVMFLSSLNFLFPAALSALACCQRDITAMTFPDMTFHQTRIDIP